MSHLTFIDKSEYALPSWEWDFSEGQKILRWNYQESSGLLKSDFRFTRPITTGQTDDNGAPIIEQQEFYPFDEAIESGYVPEFDQAAWDAEQTAIAEQQAVNQFRKSREQMVAESTVQVSSGKNFHADELAQRRMLSAILAADFRGLQDSDILPSGWSTADVPTGVMDTTVTLSELKEAHALSIENMGQIWSLK